MSCCTRNKNLFQKSGSIVEGFANMITGSNQELANKRIAICHTCDYLRNGRSCGICGCIVDAKARVKSEACPHPKGNKWAPTDYAVAVKRAEENA